jgi:hypothetical protein
MTNESSPTEKRRGEKPSAPWLLLPLSLFPLVALLTYDWRAIEALQTPPLPSSNWIGALGDTFAYAGYTLIGLAVWLVPLLCLCAAAGSLSGRRLSPGFRKLWLGLFLSSAACLVQLLQNRAPGLDALLASLNLSNAGGAIGYLLMTRFLAPLIGHFGAAILMGSLLAFSLVAAIGIKNIADGFKDFRYTLDKFRFPGTLGLTQVQHLLRISIHFCISSLFSCRLICASGQRIHCFGTDCIAIKRQNIQQKLFFFNKFLLFFFNFFCI